MSDFTFYAPDNAPGESAQLLRDIEKQYGFIPNLFAYMAESPAVLKSYLQLNKLLQETSFNNAQLQILLLAISTFNECGFCRAAHRAMAKKSGANPQTVDAILDNGVIEDRQDRALVETVMQILYSRGWLEDGQLQAFFDAGFSKKHYLELMITVSIKTLSNYINHVTHPEVNDELKA